MSSKELQGISLRELAFIRDVLVPRAWVQGPEVDELVRLRVRLEQIFAAVRGESEGAQQKEGEPC